MHVTTILAHKGRLVEVAREGTLVRSIAETLTRLKIGAIVVLDESDKLTGIVSERDIVRAIADHGADVLDRPVTHIMTRDVVTCREHDTIDGLMALMTERRFRHLPVIEDERLVGIVSIGDVVKLRVAEVETDAAALRDYIQAA
ncbi:MAG: CBS domain-containing protein [Hyphomicrobiaceae bacterium]